MNLTTAQRTHIATVYARVENAGADACTRPSDIITRSWGRCIRQHGLDPGRVNEARIVTHTKLREHREQVDELLSVARAGIEQLYRHIEPLDYVLLLSDRSGITVEGLCSSGASQTLRRKGLCSGADWSEQHSGTCAVGTCIEESLALTCHRGEHFDANHIVLTCTSAPVFAPDGDLQAVLTIATSSSPSDKNSQNFALPLVSIYTHMIEDAYFLHLYRNKRVFRFGPSRELVRINGPYLLAIEGDGEVIAANTKARDLLRHSPPHYAGGVGPAALNVTHLFDCEVTDILDISSTMEDRTRAFRTNYSDDVFFATLIEPHRPSGHLQRGDPPTEDVPVLDSLAADDPTMRRTIACAKRLRNEQINVLIVGETGVGKERLAQALHNASNRASKPFVAVNCAAIPESLIESELFGYVAGAFTGARIKGMKGLIQQSNGGTLFLDEIGDMPLHLQTRLLRVLSENEVLPLGAQQPQPVDLRVISATHRNIQQLLNDGGFREDLYYRLNGATLVLPPLRDRADKLYIIQQIFNVVRGANRSTKIRGDAMSTLLMYSWPGNIRELFNALRFALATSESDEFITVADLPDNCVGNVGHSAIDNASVPQIHESASELYQLLREHNWNITSVSKILGVSRPTVYRRMRKQQIVQPNLRG